MNGWGKCGGPGENEKERGGEGEKWSIVGARGERRRVSAGIAQVTCMRLVVKVVHKAV